MRRHLCELLLFLEDDDGVWIEAFDLDLSNIRAIYYAAIRLRSHSDGR